MAKIAQIKLLQSALQTATQRNKLLTQRNNVRLGHTTFHAEIPIDLTGGWSQRPASWSQAHF
jgi:hypothetical protein